MFGDCDVFVCGDDVHDDDEPPPSRSTTKLSDDSCFLRSHRARTPLRIDVLASEKPLVRMSSKSTTLEVMIYYIFFEFDFDLLCVVLLNERGGGRRIVSCAQPRCDHNEFKQ